jgi:Protein of unknown function (DUF4229)
VNLFIKYTLARLGVFFVCYVVIWAIAFPIFQVDFDQLSGLSTALVALIISSVISYKYLAGLRNEFAAQVEARAARAKDAFDAQRRAEDGQPPSDDAITPESRDA